MVLVIDAPCQLSKVIEVLIVFISLLGFIVDYIFFQDIAQNSGVLLIPVCKHLVQLLISLNFWGDSVSFFYWLFRDRQSLTGLEVKSIIWKNIPNEFLHIFEVLPVPLDRDLFSSIEETKSTLMKLNVDLFDDLLSYLLSQLTKVYLAVIVIGCVIVPGN